MLEMLPQTIADKLSFELNLLKIGPFSSLFFIYFLLLFDLHSPEVHSLIY